ncbi:unnamed protein product [Miscanthus lutarioriparius]|uniref:AN1-type domain-containing protein n=1 Tax=Miscanthus lutarioriparius TaxID=422564 RepID=A0A811NR68_9POAL|nr:unnamed protein product [Miscanthus lutarioriparius]
MARLGRHGASVPRTWARTATRRTAWVHQLSTSSRTAPFGSMRRIQSGGFFCAFKHNPRVSPLNLHAAGHRHCFSRRPGHPHRSWCARDCGDAIERTAVPGQQCDREILDAHARSRRCDPARKRKPQCPVRRCKEALTFSNTSQCKGCGLKVCLKHRFPADHNCAAAAAGAKRAGSTAGCGRDVQKKQGGCRPALAVSARSFKIS